LLTKPIDATCVRIREHGKWHGGIEHARLHVGEMQFAERARDRMILALYGEEIHDLLVLSIDDSLRVGPNL
jgi:hypothetical protein